VTVATPMTVVSVIAPANAIVTAVAAIVVTAMGQVATSVGLT